MTNPFARRRRDPRGGAKAVPAEARLGYGRPMRLPCVAVATFAFLLLLPASAWAADTRTYRQTIDVALSESGDPKTSSSPANLFEIVYEVDLKAKVIHRRSTRRLDEKVADTNYPQDYVIVGQTKLMRDDHKTEVVIIAVNTSVFGKCETIWLGETVAASSENSATFMLWHTGRYQRVR